MIPSTKSASLTNPHNTHCVRCVLSTLMFSLILILTSSFADANSQSATEKTVVNPAVTNAATVDTNSTKSATTANSDDYRVVLEEDNALGMYHDLSPWGMYQNADIVVKIVIICLVIASITTWTIWIAKGFELLGAKRRLCVEIVHLKKATTIKEASSRANKEGTLANLLIHEALKEMRLSVNILENKGIKERVAFRLDRLVSAYGRNMIRCTGVLATIGSTAPFVGLFGTVWGIMNSFISIVETQATNISVVAPGIAEALLSTALGLVVAIPALVFYNAFARLITSYKAQVLDASAEILMLVSRDLDRQPIECKSQPKMVNVG